MATDALMTGLVLFIVFVTVAALLGIVTQRVAVPYSVALVAAGLVAGIVLPTTAPLLTPELVLVVLLPGLVFEASLRIDLGELKRSLGSVVFLAGPGVIVSATVVAVGLAIGTGLPFELGIVAGAMLAATDPAAVLAAFRKLGVPRRLATVTEGESLFNDGAALVLFALTISALATSVTIADVAWTLAVVIIVSLIIGIAAGFAASLLLRLVDDHLIELAISVSVAYGTYFVADLFHESAVIATVVAGIVLGNFGRRTSMSRRAAEALDTVWEFAAFLLTALAFMVVGLSISISQLVAAAPWIVWAVAAVLIGRGIIVVGLLGIGWRLRRPADPLALGTDSRWLRVLFWAGLRGAVAVAMALSLPESVPQRALLQEIVFGTVLFTLVVQGTTIEPLVRRWLR